MIGIDIAALTDGRISEFRPGQGELAAEIIARLWSGSRFVVFSAPPGTGKSIVARAIAQDRALITTSTVHLQEQYRETLGLPIIKGRRWYQCIAALLPMTAEDAPCAFDHRFQCPSRERCEFYRAKTLAINSRVAVVNNSLFWVELAISSPLVVDRKLLVIDEAHRFMDDLTSCAGAELPIDTINFLTDGRLPLNASIVEWAASIAPTVRRKTADAYRMERMRLAMAGRRLLFTLSLIVPGSEWMTAEDIVGGERVVRIYPTNPEVLIGLVLKRYRVVAMSASITDRYISEMWRVPASQFDYIVSDITFPKENRPIIFIPVAAMNRDSSPEDLDAVAMAIERIASAHAGQRGVVHTVSMRLTNEIVRRLSLDGRVIVGYGRDRLEAFRKFTQTPGAILVGPSFGEGVDFRDDLARWQVVPKIPFPDRNDPRVARLTDSQYRAMAATALVQMYGRGVRSEKDYCTLYVLDANLKMVQAFLPEWVTRAIVTVPSR